MRKIGNIYRLSVKELWSLWRDPAMLVVIIFIFTANIYTSAKAMPESLHKAPIAFVDEDKSLHHFISHQAVKLYEVATVSAGNSAPQDEGVFKGGIYHFVRTSDVGKIRKGTIIS